jgi:plastocyanin
MFSSSRGMVWVAAAAAVSITVPALAQGQGAPSPASYTASDSATASRDTFRWYVTGTTATDVTVAEGGTVSFSSPTAAVRPHNVDFTDTVKPGCQLSTSDTASTAPMPPAPAREWSGTCAFDQPGTYHFRCDIHPAMTGTITVTPNPAATTAPTPIPAADPATGTPAQPGNQPLAAIWIAVGHHQQGSVSGSLIVSRPGTRVDVSLLSRRVALGLSGKRRVRVGHSVIAAAPAGPMQFSITLNAIARRALRDRKTLPVLVEVKASAPLTSPVDRFQAVRMGRAPRRAR